MENHNTFNKIAVINDMTGFGRCSLAVEIPIISHMGIQCCPVPTTIFSNHSAYKSFYYQDWTDYMEPYFAEWEKLKLRFNGILTGFYGSDRQIDIVKKFIDEFADEDTLIIVDPIMGDDGATYSTYTKSMCDKMGELAEKADIITPNLTELCILTKEAYKEHFTYDEIRKMCRKLAKDMKVGSKIVVTGIKRGDFLSNMVFEDGKDVIIRRKIAGETRCGTGDVFSSIIAADAVLGVDLIESVKKAADFISECIKASVEAKIPITDGVCFEKVLSKL